MVAPRQRFLTLVLVFLALPAGSALAQVVYRWVDDAGEVHYNTTLPAEYANRPHQILKDGIVIRSIDDPSKPPLTEEEVEKEKVRENPKEAERQKQVRADRLLVLKYRSEEEILDAMKVEIDNLSYDARLIEQSRQSALTSLNGEIREAADRQRSGLEPDPETAGKIARLRARLAEGARSKQSLELREEQIRGLFRSELERYRFLLDGGAPGEPYPADTAGDSGP
jgi:hypothetical protein